MKPRMIEKNRINKALENIYYNYGNEGALNNNPRTLLRLLRNSIPTAGLDDISTFLSKQPSYTVHKRINRLQFPRRSILVPAGKVRADADLIELPDLKSWNDGFIYVLTIIDAFSRFLWAVPLKRKDAETTAAALKKLGDSEGDTFNFLYLYTDAGKEFVGAPFQSVLKAKGIKHRICASDDFHCPFVERVNRTIKEKLFQGMTTMYSRRWIDLLPSIVSTYNKTIHSATGLKPQEAGKPQNHLKALTRLTNTRLKRRQWRKKYRFKVGDLVRIHMTRGGALGRKGYLPRYSWEIFRIKKLANDRSEDVGSPPAYIIEDLNGEKIEHSIFYEAELSPVHKDQLKKAAPIREILAEEGNKIKVWFQGFPKSSASWIDRKKLV